MHRTKFLLPALTLVLFSLTLLRPAAAQQASALNAGDFSSAPYQVGEKLTYNVSFSTFGTAAHVETLVAERGPFFNREGIELRAHVQTVEVVSAALYAINNDYVSFVDPRTGLPFHTEVLKHQGELPAEASRDPSQLIEATRRPVPDAIDNAPTTFDFLAALYRLRALPLAQGSIYRFTAQNAGTAYQVELKVSGRESVKTTAGSFNALVTQLRVSGNPEANNYRVRIYFTDDARHIPLLMTLKLPAGEVRAELASAEMSDVAPTPGILALATPTPLPTPAPAPISTPTPGRRLTPAPASGDDPPPKSRNELPFKIGEQLNFNFYLGNAAQPIGVASYLVRAHANFFGRDGFLFASTMATTSVGQMLFPVSDRIDSYVDATTLFPFRTELRTEEGRHRAAGVISLDQDRGSAVATDGKAIEIPVGTYDLVSVIYALRSFDLNPPKRNAVSLLLNNRPRTLFITSLQREIIELGGQRIPAVQLSLATDDPQGNRFNLRLWVSADRRHLPLRFIATTPFGPVRADLSIIPLAEQ